MLESSDKLVLSTPAKSQLILIKRWAPHWCVISQNCLIIYAKTYRLFTEENFEPLVVGDVLNLRDHYFTRLLEEPFVIPLGIQDVQSEGYTIMFTNPYGVHRR